MEKPRAPPSSTQKRMHTRKHTGGLHTNASGTHLLCVPAEEEPAVLFAVVLVLESRLF